tara:strand:- start:183 stop:851 length:669 start_codon:yes stop_codon:yes gene_type:complete
MSNIIKSPAKLKAIELYASIPSITNEEVSNTVGVSIDSVKHWRRDPNFIDAIYDRYMLEFGGELPSVLTAMIREAKAGNVQAGRLVLEHSGKLVKNINVTVDSPFEKFLKKVENIEDAEIVEDDVIVDIVEELPENHDLPPRNEENQAKRAKKEKKELNKSIKDEIKRQEYNKKQKEWYNWRKRAKKVGVEPLKNRRPTPGQREEWKNQIIAAEKLVAKLEE